MENLNWEEEAQAVVNDISTCVSNAALSGINTNQHFEARVAYLNIKTKEGDKLTVKLDVQGFSVVGRDFDNKSLEKSGNLKYETIYALLNHLSPSYTQAFAQKLSDKLARLTDGAGREGGE